MEYLEGWELVLGHDDCNREKISTGGSADSQSSSVSPRLDTEISTEKKKESPNPTVIAEAIESDYPDRVSPISFKNIKETKFAEMKLLESSQTAVNEEVEEEDHAIKEDSEEFNGGGGFDLWKWTWGLTGIGALCSFGVATVCVLVLGGVGPGVQAKNNMGFKGYEENQRLEKMVSAVRGGGSVPLTRAHISFGGYFDDAHSLNH